MPLGDHVPSGTTLSGASVIAGAGKGDDEGVVYGDGGRCGQWASAEGTKYCA